MRRHLFTAASALSLLVSLASVALWLRSYQTWDLMMRNYCSPIWFDPTNHDASPSGSYMVDLFKFDAIYSRDGRFAWSRRVVEHEAQAETIQIQNGWSWTVQPSRTPSWIIRRNLITFSLVRLTFAEGWKMDVAAPHWAIAAVTAILPIIWLRGFRRRKRLARVGYCQRCGYDLRSSTGRGSECGTPIPEKAPRA
jgi:hypothetical protein